MIPKTCVHFLYTVVRFWSFQVVCEPSPYKTRGRVCYPKTVSPCWRSQSPTKLCYQLERWVSVRGDPCHPSPPHVGTRSEHPRPQGRERPKGRHRGKGYPHNAHFAFKMATLCARRSCDWTLFVPLFRVLVKLGNNGLDSDAIRDDINWKYIKFSISTVELRFVLTFMRLKL